MLERLRGGATARWLALLSGATLVVIGIVGFAVGTPTLLCILHLASGLAGVVLARVPDGARAFLTVGGVAYLGLWLLGVGAVGGWIPLGPGDNWLHFVLGVALLAASGVPRRL